MTLKNIRWSTVQALLHAGEQRLARAGVDEPRREARLLLAHVMKVEPGQLLWGAKDTPANETEFEAALARREQHEPLAYITGARGFWSFDVRVSPATLIPRPDSETLVEALCSLKPRRSAVRTALDLGTGTGCLLLAVLMEYPAAYGVGVDIDENTARMARDNARALGLSGRSSFVVGSWAGALRGSFDIIISNPPYIPTADIERLAPDVRAYEPRRALDGGADGLQAYRALLESISGKLSASGLGVFEVGIGQAREVCALIQARGFLVQDVRRDLAGVERAVIFSSQ